MSQHFDHASTGRAQQSAQLPSRLASTLSNTKITVHEDGSAAYDSLFSDISWTWDGIHHYYPTPRTTQSDDGAPNEDSNEVIATADVAKLSAGITSDDRKPVADQSGSQSTPATDRPYQDPYIEFNKMCNNRWRYSKKERQRIVNARKEADKFDSVKAQQEYHDTEQQLERISRQSNPSSSEEDWTPLEKLRALRNKLTQRKRKQRASEVFDSDSDSDTLTTAPSETTLESSFCNKRSRTKEWSVDDASFQDWLKVIPHDMLVRKGTTNREEYLRQFKAASVFVFGDWPSSIQSQDMVNSLFTMPKNDNEASTSGDGSLKFKREVPVPGIVASTVPGPMEVDEAECSQESVTVAASDSASESELYKWSDGERRDGEVSTGTGMASNVTFSKYRSS